MTFHVVREPSRFAKSILSCCHRRLSTRVPLELSSLTYGDTTRDIKSPPLVICHGLFGSKQNWNSIAKAIQRSLGCVVYAVDLRNHGSSPHSEHMTYPEMAADVHVFLQRACAETGFNRAHLLGHSMGGKVAMRMAVDPENIIERLIVEDVAPKRYTNNVSQFRGYVDAMRTVNLRQSRKDILEQLAPAVPELAVRQFLATNLQPSSSVSGQFEWRCNLEAISAYVDEILGNASLRGSFSGETLFLYGKRSNYVMAEDHSQIRQTFPRARFEGIPDAGHWLHADQPKLFIDAVCKFLA